MSEKYYQYLQVGAILVIVFLLAGMVMFMKVVDGVMLGLIHRVITAKHSLLQ